MVWFKNHYAVSCGLLFSYELLPFLSSTLNETNEVEQGSNDDNFGMLLSLHPHTLMLLIAGLRFFFQRRLMQKMLLENVK